MVEVISTETNSAAAMIETIINSQLCRAMEINAAAPLDVHPANTCVVFLQATAKVLAAIDRAAAVGLLRAYASHLEAGPGTLANAAAQADFARHAMAMMHTINEISEFPTTKGTA